MEKEVEVYCIRALIFSNPQSQIGPLCILRFLHGEQVRHGKNQDKAKKHDRSGIGSAFRSYRVSHIQPAAPADELIVEPRSCSGIISIHSMTSEGNIPRPRHAMAAISMPARIDQSTSCTRGGWGLSNDREK